jgi:hypothetical protein
LTQTRPNSTGGIVTGKNKITKKEDDEDSSQSFRIQSGMKNKVMAFISSTKKSWEGDL